MHTCVLASLRVRAAGSFVLKRKVRRKRGAEFVDADFAEILYGEAAAGHRQPSGATEEPAVLPASSTALNLALADASWLSSECELFVDDVSPRRIAGT